MDFYNKHGSYTEIAQQIDREVEVFLKSVIIKYADSPTAIRHIAGIMHGAVSLAASDTIIRMNVNERKKGVANVASDHDQESVDPV